MRFLRVVSPFAFVTAIAAAPRIMRLPRLSVACALLLGLSGCTSLITPAPNQTQRGVAQYIQDQANVKKVLDALYQTDPRFTYARIQPHAFMGVLLLTGQVPDTYMGQLAIDAIQQKSNVTGITLIHNYLSTDDKPTYQQIAQDEYITTTVRKGVYALDNVSDKSIYIVSEKATLFVMGRVSEANANAIVAIAQQTPGLAKVVMLVDIIKQQTPVIPVAKAIPVVYNSGYIPPAVAAPAPTVSVAAPANYVSPAQSPTITTQSSLQLQQQQQQTATATPQPTAVPVVAKAAPVAVLTTQSSGYSSTTVAPSYVVTPVRSAITVYPDNPPNGSSNTDNQLRLEQVP